ncbi:MAG: carboxypeptidase regulatory-like domain-containing protein [Acidobacteria bacterium]|nr:carboxypeptidase regulatory-like domain-containing protein [Acidobacteriota bacterium]MCA1642561.1 carboxypeptidase regulatory-like domain-containing protein [Acidobacteriota bacterium]
MRFRLIPLIAFAALLCASSSAEARAQGHSIRGKVRNAAGSNVSRAIITLEKNGAPVDQTVANNEGDFSFTGLTETSYTVVVSAPDYNPASESVDFVRPTNADSAGETRTVEITLLAKGGVRPPRAGLNFAQNVPRTARDAFESGVRLARENKPAEAVAAYEGAIKIFPDYFDAHFVLASEFARQGKFDDATKHLQEARRVNERDDRVWELFARILMRQRKFAVAARVFGEASRLNPTDAQYLVSQASAFIEQASATDASKSKAAADEREFAFAEAEKSLARAEQLDRKLAEVNLQRARLYEKRGDRARAASELEQYLRKAPNAKNAEGVRQAIKTLRSQAAAPKTP